MKYDSKLSKEEATLSLLISFYKLERTFVFQPIYLQKLFEDIKQNNPEAYQKLQDTIGVFDYPIERYLDKLLKFNYLKKRDEISYEITISDNVALQLDKFFRNREHAIYQTVLTIKRSLYSLDKKPIEDEMEKNYSTIITTEDFLSIFFTKLFSIKEYTFSLEAFKDAFSCSILDGVAMKQFLEDSFKRPFMVEDMPLLITKVIGVDQKQNLNDGILWLGTNRQNVNMLEVLENNDKQIIYEMVKKYLEKKKTIQKGPSVVK